MTWASIEKCIATTNPRSKSRTSVSYLTGINFFDIYRGKQIPSGKKGIAFNLCFQAQDRTLKSEEVDIALQKILNDLQETLGVELRKQ